MKTILISILFILIPYLSYSQTVVNDSTICLTVEEARIIAKITEDLRYTKEELVICDSIIDHQRNIIVTQDSIISRQENIIDECKTNTKKKSRFWSGVGLVVGIIIGILL